jgi:hypothetical protein
MQTPFFTAVALIVLALIVLVGGCAGAAEPPGTTAPPADAQPVQPATETATAEEPRQGISPRSKQPRRVPQAVEPLDDPAGTSVELPPQLRARVLADAARRGGVSEREVVVRSAQAVQFPDGSLGCPQPGMMYTQMVVPGYRVVVEAGGKTFDYRSTRDGEPAICVPRFGELQPRPVPRESNR